MCEAPGTLVEPGSKGRWVFSKSVAQRVIDLHAAIETIESRANRRLLRIILGSILLVVSNVIVNGKGRRYRGGWEKRNCTPEVVDEAFRQTFQAVMIDLKQFGARACSDYRLIRGDCRELHFLVGRQLTSQSSPRHTRTPSIIPIFTIWSFGCWDISGTKEENSTLRNQTLRSHVQIKRSFETLRNVSAKAR